MRRYLSTCLALWLSASAACGAGTLSAGSHGASTLASREAALEEMKRLTAADSFQNARTLVGQLLGRYPEDPQVHIAAASLFQKMGLADQAITEYDLANKLNPHLVEPMIALSELHLESLDLDLGLSFARLAVKEQPASEPAHIALATALVASDRLTDANKEISQLLRKVPNNPGILYLAYQLNRKRGDLSTASSFLKSAIQQSPPKQQWLYEQSELLEMIGDYNGALRSLKELLAVQPNSVEARAKLANVLEFSCRDYDAAIQQYQKLRELDPDSPTAEAGIERCQSKKNDLASQLKVVIHNLLSALFQRLRHGDSSAQPTASTGNSNR